MYRDPEQIRRQLQEIIEKFRLKGATTPEKAMTIQELGLQPRFEQAMHRRLGQTGIFIELNGKYYLNEDRFKQIQEQRTKMRQANNGRTPNNQHSPSWLRYTGILLMLPIGIILALVLFYFFTFNGGYFPGEILIILLIVVLGVFVARILHWRSRRKYWRQQWIPNVTLKLI
jgi:hypothetical protein